MFRKHALLDLSICFLLSLGAQLHGFLGDGFLRTAPFNTAVTDGRNIWTPYMAASSAPMPITPQARRPPALPVDLLVLPWVPRSESSPVPRSSGCAGTQIDEGESPGLDGSGISVAGCAVRLAGRAQNRAAPKKDT